jgi:hypothetical protein
MLAELVHMHGIGERCADRGERIWHGDHAVTRGHFDLICLACVDSQRRAA